MLNQQVYQNNICIGQILDKPTTSTLTAVQVLPKVAANHYAVDMADEIHVAERVLYSPPHIPSGYEQIW